jgi:hypothetical protein
VLLVRFPSPSIGSSPKIIDILTIAFSFVIFEGPYVLTFSLLP